MPSPPSGCYSFLTLLLVNVTRNWVDGAPSLDVVVVVIGTAAGAAVSRRVTGELA